ncbi:MAG TPA: hypothetical protein VNO30_38485 [Kofleriaceae bacterium]|nr:hypothetical protein [Kofleriaceae bacterium]
MHPRVMAILQRQYAAEPGTGGGMRALTPQPQFGSVRSSDKTPAQQRQSGEP